MVESNLFYYMYYGLGYQEIYKLSSNKYKNENENEKLEVIF